MNTAPDRHKPRIVPLVVLWIAIGGTWALSGYLLYDNNDRGTFGDMFGAVNALFSGLAFATLIYTTWMQREELALQRQELAATRTELEGQRIQLEQQTTTFALQRFEDSFFALLKVQGEIVDSMDLVNERGRVTKSRDCFAVWYRRLQDFHSQHAVYPDGQAFDTIQLVYEHFYNNHQAELGHYFRHLYHIVKFVKGAPIENKRKYTALVRAQLSAYEHLLLFYNGVSKHGYAKFKPLIEEFALLENMPQKLVISPELHLPLYAASAYGDDVL